MTHSAVCGNWKFLLQLLINMKDFFSFTRWQQQVCLLLRLTLNYSTLGNVVWAEIGVIANTGKQTTVPRSTCEQKKQKGGGYKMEI